MNINLVLSNSSVYNTRGLITKAFLFLVYWSVKKLIKLQKKHLLDFLDLQSNLIVPCHTLLLLIQVMKIQWSLTRIREITKLFFNGFSQVWDTT